MALQERAEAVSKSIVSLLGDDLAADKAAEITKIVETALVDAYRDCTERNTKAAIAVCEPDMDKAHKVAAEMRRNTTALVANLSSLR